MRDKPNYCYICDRPCHSSWVCGACIMDDGPMVIVREQWGKMPLWQAVIQYANTHHMVARRKPGLPVNGRFPGPVAKMLKQTLEDMRHYFVDEGL